MIRAYDEELNAFKARVMEVVKENQQLHMSVSKSSPDALGPDEWQQLQEQAKLVVEENALLMEQQEIQDRKMKEIQRVHGQEVSKLSKRISSQESSQRRLETELDDMRRTHSNLLRKHEAIVGEQEHKMSVQEHLRIMDECRSVLEDLKAKTKLETEEYNSRLQAIQKEKSNVAIKFADAEAKNAQLERELEAYKKSLKKSERNFLFLQRKLEHIQERELTAQETLSQVLTVAEKTAAERDNYVQFAKTQKVQQEKAASKILAGTQNIKGLEEKLQEYRKKASDKVAVVTGRLREKEKEINKLKEQYEEEINNLRAMVRQKQRQLELMIGENRNVDKELELVWKTAAADNRRMKDTVRQKGGMFDSDSDPNAHLSSEEGEAA
ncbi:centrosomal protein of 89 kDa-like [Oculina patagonica]